MRPAEPHQSRPRAAHASERHTARERKDGAVPILQSGSLRLDPQARRLAAGSTEVVLTARECELMAFFLRHVGECLTRRRILSEAWQIHFDPGTNLLDVHVWGLRKKLRECGLQNVIQTVRGIGFRCMPSGSPTRTGAPDGSGRNGIS